MPKMDDNIENLEEDLENLTDRYNNDRLSLQEEKRIILEIDALKRSIPMVKPLKEIGEKLKVLRQEKSEKGKVMNAVYK